MATKREPANLQLTLAQNMKRLRKELDLSQMQLAERCGVSTSFIGEIEICRKFPAPRVLEAIAAGFGVKAYQLIYDGEGDELETHRNRASLASFSRDLQERLHDEIQQLTSLYLKRSVSPDSEQVAERPSGESPGPSEPKK